MKERKKNEDILPKKIIIENLNRDRFLDYQNPIAHHQ